MIRNLETTTIITVSAETNMYLNSGFGPFANLPTARTEAISQTEAQSQIQVIYFMENRKAALTKGCLSLCMSRPSVIGVCVPAEPSFCNEYCQQKSLLCRVHSKVCSTPVM
jgi:hypothetical protein